MHPIEHLRHLARAGDIPPEWLVPEAATALRGLADDRHALVLACRKLLEHHARCGPLWWLCGRLLTARNPRAVLDESIETFVDDPTPLHLSLTLAGVSDDGPQPFVVETTMVGGSGVLVDDATVSADGADTGVAGAPPVWVVAGIGTFVADEVFRAVTGTPVVRPGTARVGNRREHRPPVVVLDPAQIDLLIRPTGVEGVAVLRGAPDAPVVPELLARD